MALRALLVMAFALVVTVGCEKKAPPAGGSTPAPATGGAAAPATPAATPAAAATAAGVMGTAVISGTITVDGNVPAPAPIDMKSKPECAAHAANSDTLLVGANKGLKDCFVHISKGVAGKYPPPTAPAVIDQKGCMYVPHVFGVVVGQDIEIRNSDPFGHNINIKDNNPINVAMQGGQPPVVKKAHFKRKGVPTSFACDIHPWMSAKACVVENPFYAVTDADGKFSITGLPAGKYTVEVWHEAAPGLTIAVKSAEVEVKDGETKTQDFKYAYAN